MIFYLVSAALLLQDAFAAPTTQAAAAATVAKIRGVSSPVFHLYLQTNPRDAAVPVLGPEAGAEAFTIGGSIRSTNTTKYLNIVDAATSYKPLVLESTSNTTAWGLEGDTIITVQGSKYGRQLNFLTCASTTASGYYDLFLQTGSDTPAGRTCSNYKTIHLPCLC